MSNVEIDTCPECKKDIREKLVYLLLGRLWGNNFEYECECGALLEINVVPIPEFEVSVKENRPTKDALDDGDSAASSGIVHASALSGSQALSTPAPSPVI